MWSTLNLAPRRKSSRWSWESLACTSGLASGLADWPLAAHSAPAPAPAATPASAAACFRNRLRPDPLVSMIASVIPNLRFELRLGANASPTSVIGFSKLVCVSTGVVLVRSRPANRASGALVLGNRGYEVTQDPIAVRSSTLFNTLENR